jgi:hypothetical protein
MRRFPHDAAVPVASALSLLMRWVPWSRVLPFLAARLQTPQAWHPSIHVHRSTRAAVPQCLVLDRQCSFRRLAVCLLLPGPTVPPDIGRSCAGAAALVSCVEPPGASCRISCLRPAGS